MSVEAACNLADAIRDLVAPLCWGAIVAAIARVVHLLLTDGHLRR